MAGSESLSQKLADAIQAVLPLVDNNMKFENQAVDAFNDLRRACLQYKNAAKELDIFESQVAHAVPVYRFLIKFTERFHKVRIRQISEVLQCILTTSSSWESAFESCPELEESLRKLPQAVQQELVRRTSLTEEKFPDLSSLRSGSQSTEPPKEEQPETPDAEDPPVSAVSSMQTLDSFLKDNDVKVAKKYMWMWGDRNFIATFNPVRWSEYQSASSMAQEFEKLDSNHTSRPVKIKDAGSGDWKFETVPEAIVFLRGEMARAGK